MSIALELDDIQAFLRHGYPNFDAAAYCLFSIDNDAAGTKEWLRNIMAAPEPNVWVDHAATRTASTEGHDSRIALAFTAHGLRALGLRDSAFDTFIPEFREGMAAPHRARLLGDTDDNAPRNWHWGARDDEVDGLLIVFSDARRNDATSQIPNLTSAQIALENDPYFCPYLDARVREIESLPRCPRFIQRVTGRLGIEEGTGVSREPFGFVDGISQPYVEGLTRREVPPRTPRINAGEFVLGYRNAIGRFPAAPSVAPQDDPDNLLPRLAPSGRGDLGRNGTFLVVRQLEQNVARFNTFVGQDRALAARLVGRWWHGAALMQGAVEAGMSQRELEATNDFGYHHEDPHGFRCPIGAHIRRANPRDSFALSLGVSPQRAQEIVDQHRILRRGRAYRQNGEQGLMFICLNANIERQFEFVQGSWLMHPQFGGLACETDPLLGAAGRCMTVQRPLLGERLDGLEQFVTVKGGGYFFLPGLRALRYLAQLP